MLEKLEGTGSEKVRMLYYGKETYSGLNKVTISNWWTLILDYGLHTR